MNARELTRQVIARAEQLSNELLDHETTAFEAAHAVYTGHVDAAAAAVTDATGRIRDRALIVNDAKLRSALAARHSDALAATVTIASDLASTASRLALAAIQDELTVCAALANVRDGVAVGAVRASRTTANKITAARVTAYDVDTTEPAQAWFRAETRRQLVLWADTDETPEQLTARLLSPEPVRLHGAPARGVLFRALNFVNTGLRAVSIAVTNDTRLDAMAAFNRRAVVPSA